MSKVVNSADAVRRSPVMLVVIGLLFLAAVAAAFLFVRSQKLQAATQSTASPVASAVAQALPAVATAPVLADDVAQLETRFDQLQEQLDKIDPRITSINHSLLRLIESVDAMNKNVTTLLARVPEPKPAATHRPAVRRTPRPVKKPKAPVLPSLVSVDTWGNHSNATIRNSDGSIRFVRTGDVVGVARVGAIDPDARSITLVMPNGTKSSLVAPR